MVRRRRGGERAEVGGGDRRRGDAKVGGRGLVRHRHGGERAKVGGGVKSKDVNRSGSVRMEYSAPKIEIQT